MLKISYSPSLKWEIKIWWSKNAALPVYAASLLIDDPDKRPELENTPQILDLQTLMQLANVAFANSDKFFDLTSPLASKIRSSILLIPIGLKKFGEVHFYGAWGCKLGKRPLDAFDDWLAQAWVKIIQKDQKKIYKAQKKPNTRIILDQFSVTTTEALLTYLAFGKDQEPITIYNIATEPHVLNLIDYLNQIWAKIHLEPNHKAIVVPQKQPQVKIKRFKIIGDYLEAWTYFALGSVSPDSQITLRWINPEDLFSFLKKAQKIGIDYEILDEQTISVNSSNLKNYKATNIQTMIFPGFPTDLHPIMATVLTQASGISKIHETLFEWRFNYLLQLENLGAKFEILNPHQVIIIGKTKLKGNYISSTDIRGWGAMLIAWAIAQGETYILNEQMILRGYEKVVQKLQWIGVNIQSIPDN